ncbi:nuclear transport factor 2 family protein [Leptobacterium flavescens]|uniref:Nuclear transport factor 2 family protein n=1 Tax=Leptobacterium flavescens TaxID=472055 RepID=A0A6P0UF65_9FLAO|nr:nuclear transport factor 2 family protein [Leptobacterium flavescens]NER11914.1 nuclear transport factor 2 family protein [Leptobacterium flavescens]
MGTQEVANRLVSLCREGQNAQAIEELYADNVVSKEMPGFPGELASGKAEVLQKNMDWFASIAEFHGSEISEPVVAGNHFTCRMSFDATFKDRGRQQMEEVCVFEVNDGKIVNEQFFYQFP